MDLAVDQWWLEKAPTTTSYDYAAATPPTSSSLVAGTYAKKMMRYFLHAYLVREFSVRLTLLLGQQALTSYLGGLQLLNLI